MKKMGESSVHSCRLCSIILNPFGLGEIRRCDIPFHKSTSFLTIPALGPLCLGHAMIISRRHFPSLLNMECNFRKEFEEVCSTLSSVWPTQQLIFAEHGSSVDDGNGPCIAHTHVNIIPDIPENILLLEKYGHQLLAKGPLNTLPNMTTSYFLIGRKDMWFLYDTAAAPSQHIRQLLFTHFNLPHWDWRLFSNLECSSETLDKWNNLLTHSYNL
jgi:hypothetical protein